MLRINVHFRRIRRIYVLFVTILSMFPAVRREGYIGEVLQSAANRNRSIASGNRSLIYAFVRSAFLLRCPIKSSHHGGCLILSTAATRSVRFFCHRQRSLRSPMPLSLVTFLCGHKKVTPAPFHNRAINCNLKMFNPRRRLPAGVFHITSLY